MRAAVGALLVTTVFVSARAAGVRAGEAFDLGPWRRLAVQEGGRTKPLDTLARETLRMLSNRAACRHPLSGQKLSPVAFYMAMLFERPLGAAPNPTHAMPIAGPHSDYFERHRPDAWDEAPLLRVDFLELRAMLGMAKDEKYISPLNLSRAMIEDPHSGDVVSFTAWASRLINKPRDKRVALEQNGLELADRLWSYQDHRTGHRLTLLPVFGDDHKQWLSVAELQHKQFNDANDPTGHICVVKRFFEQARDAYRAGDVAAFHAASAALLSAARRFGPQLGDYPTQSAIDLEVAYNRWAPFRFAWVFTLAACLALFASMGWNARWLYGLGLAAMSAGLIAMLVGFGMRTVISGRAPVTNMCESVIYLGFGVAVIGLLFEAFSRRQYVLAAAAALSTVALVLADCCPAVLDPGMRPLPPMLRNNFWLIAHVMTITLSYAAFALALGIGNVTLGYCLVRPNDRSSIRSQSMFTCRALQAGVFLLAVGTVLGGVWADSSWGRFWGWDPKEVWALIALLGYVAVLHARRAGWVGHRGLAALSVACFSLVVMAWYGVNFVLGTGLHTYGFSDGGEGYVVLALMVQLSYAAICLGVSQYRGAPARAAAATARSSATAGLALATREQSLRCRH